MKTFVQLLLILSLVLTPNFVHGRKHHLKLEGDSRRIIRITSFGFFKGGFLSVQLNKFLVQPNGDSVEPLKSLIGFTLDKTLSDGDNPYTQNNGPNYCALNDVSTTENERSFSRLVFTFDFQKQVLRVNCNKGMEELNILLYRGRNDSVVAHDEVTPNGVPTVSIPKDPSPPQDQQKQSDPNMQDLQNKDYKYGQDKDSCTDQQIPLRVMKNPKGSSYSTNFGVNIPSEELQGLYKFYFHNCLSEDTTVDVDVNIVEENQGKNFLSAGEMHLPELYLMMYFIFFISGCFWVFILLKSKRESGVAVIKIHYFMHALVFLKGLSFLFHSMNYNNIRSEGIGDEILTIWCYNFHLLEGVLLFITILLIGSGYDVVKHSLSNKDKAMFMIVIPLQVVANVADIIIEESEEGEVAYTTWKRIFVTTDLLSCLVILFFIVGTMRHIRETLGTDGKAPRNLKLFRYFYFLVLGYIFFTRIIANLLLKSTVPFQYKWLNEMLLEITTLVFFIITGYNFRPGQNIDEERKN